jgi:hypothetical protein
MTPRNNIAVVDDSWMERLWAWADDRGIYEWTLPRDKLGLVNLKTLEFRQGRGNFSRWINYLEELPLEIWQLPNLQYLDLSATRLTELPKEIGQLTNLQELDLSRTKLTELPKEIRQLTNLTKLDLSATQLTELPKEIGQLTNLQELDLSRTKLTELPKEIEQLTNLKYGNWSIKCTL